MRLVSNVLRAGSAAALAATALVPQTATAQCQGPFAGGLIPATGAGGGGTFPGTLPPTPGLFTGVATAPGVGEVLRSVKLNGLSHTWGGDVTMFIESPANPGTLHTLFSGGVNDPNIDWVGNNYEIVAASQSCVNPLPLGAGPGAANGTYTQNFNGFAGPINTANTDLESIPVGGGTWTLYAYDFVGGDSGALTSWELCFGVPTPLPPAAPTLVSPPNASVSSNPATLTWNAIGCATSYDVDVDGVVTNVVGASFVTPLLTPGTHTWRVRVATPATSAFSASQTFDVAAPPPTAFCVPGGVGGPVPAAGTGGTGAVWPTTLPATPFVSSYSVNVPTGATQLLKVDLNFSTEHTWAGDVFAVLTDPTGANHNLVHRLGSTGSGAGLNCDFNGAYSIYESAGQAWPVTCPGSGNIPAGDYDQSFGGWTSGNQGIFNTPLSAIPVSSGTWTLTIYDWAGGDSGALGSWQLCFDDNGAQSTFCVPQAPGSLAGCVPTINVTGAPNVSHSNSCVLTVSNVDGDRSGLLIYGIGGQINVPWCPGGNSRRCILNPIQRLPVQTSGGTIGQCDGSLVQDWNAYQLANPTAPGNPFLAGDTVDLQGWYRDTGSCKNSLMTQGVRLTYLP
jgi:hypothetical protein